MLAYERSHWHRQPDILLAGVDEVGRGPLAGPVYAAAVCMHADLAERLYRAELRDLTDSKKLTPARREAFHALLASVPGVSIAIGVATAAEIDEINILEATHRAMRRAVTALGPERPVHVLVDGLPVRGLPCPATAIVGGDGRSLLIAAASVVAKVLRDRYMVELHAHHPEYAFASNKGYGTHVHIEALLRYGPCPYHRRSFRPVREAAALKRLPASGSAAVARPQDNPSFDRDP